MNLDDLLNKLDEPTTPSDSLPKKPKKPAKKKKPPPDKVVRGWYQCCQTFYIGYAWHKIPPCPECGKKSRKALRSDLRRLEAAK